MSRLHGIQIFDTRSSTYKGLQFNAESPQVCAQSYLQAIGEGDVTGHSLFVKYGKCAGLQTTAMDVWESNSVYVFPSVAQKMDITGGTQDVNTTGAGAWKVKINGLLADYSEITEEVTMNGLTIVTTAASFLRINKMWVSACGSGGGVAFGTISAKGTGGSVVYGQISIGFSQSRQLIYTTPLGKSLYITSIRVSSGVGNSTGNQKNNYVIFTLRATVDPESGLKSTIFYPIGEIGNMNGSQELNLEVPTKIPATADLKIGVIGDTAQAVTCTAAIRGWIE